MASIQEKVDNNIKYIWVQIENWLKHKYGKPIQVEVYSSKELIKEHKYAKTVLEKGKPPKIYIDYHLLRKGNRKELLYAGCREAVRIGLLAHGYKINELSPEFRGELKKHGLPDYGGLPETGLSLHTYSCSDCGTIYSLKQNKMPKSKTIAYNREVLTKCCEAIIKEDGKVLYSNEELQKYKHLLGK